MVLFQAEIQTSNISQLINGYLSVSLPVKVNSSVPASITVGLCNGMGGTTAVSHLITGNKSEMYGTVYFKNTSSTNYINLTKSDINNHSFYIRYGGSYISD